MPVPTPPVLVRPLAIATCPVVPPTDPIPEIEIPPAELMLAVEVNLTPVIPVPVLVRPTIVTKPPAVIEDEDEYANPLDVIAVALILIEPVTLMLL